MVQIITAQTDLYARHLTIRKRKNSLLTILWAFGRYGEVDDDAACSVIDGSTHWKQKEFNNIVRKRDNQLHGPAAVCGGILRGYGLTFEHHATGKKSWTLKLSVDANAGGIAVIRALKNYTSRLIAAYGEPEYAGSARFKGEAYARFSRADMTMLR